MQVSSLIPTKGERRECFESARLRLARMQVRGADCLVEVLQRATELAAETLQVERVGIWLLVDENRALRCFHLYERSKREHSEGAILQAEDFPEYFRAIAERRFVLAADVARNPNTHELLDSYMKPLGITSTLDIPIFREGKVIGVVCHESVDALRDWTNEQRDFAASVADTISLQIETAERRAAESSVKKLEQHVSALHELESLAQLSRGVAHDFKNVLMVISGISELLHTNAEATAAIKSDVAQILQAVERGKELVAQLTAFGRGEKRNVRVLDIAELINSIKVMLQIALGSRRRLQIHCQPSVGKVFADRLELERAILNLVLNARDAIPNEGIITIRASVGKVEDEEGMPSAYVVISVSDTGIGMDQATLTRVFEPFFTTKTDQFGTGLGLSIVQQTAERSGGFIHIESKLGAGTTVRVYLPRICSDSPHVTNDEPTHTS